MTTSATATREAGTTARGTSSQQAADVLVVFGITGDLAKVMTFIRTGKCLPATQTELRLVFKHPPRLGFWKGARRPEPNQLVVKLDPSTGVRLAPAEADSLVTGRGRWQDPWVVS